MGEGEAELPSPSLCERGQRMFYKVVKEGLKYRDELGRDRRAPKGYVIYIELRSEIKRMIREGFIEPAPQAESVGISADIEADEIDDENEAAEPTAARQPEISDIVKASIGGAELVGEVLSVYGDGCLRVAFEGDCKSYRKVQVDEVEVLG